MHAPAASAPTPTYAPPRALPPDPSRAPTHHSFAAAVTPAPRDTYNAAAVPQDAVAADVVDAALRADLALDAPGHTIPPSDFRDSGDIAEALDAAVDLIDLKAMAAVRNAVSASRRLHEQRAAEAASRGPSQLDVDIDRVTGQLRDAGVDDDVIELITDTAVRHRLPFGTQADLDQLMRDLIGELMEIRSGFPRVGRAYRCALVGASSAGKSTVCAKLAHTYRAAGMQVGIISIMSGEPTRALATDSAYQHLDVDIRYAATPDQARQALETMSAVDLILIDTPGAAYLDAEVHEHLGTCLSAIGVDDVHVVLPLATSSRESRTIVDSFREIGANRLLISRIDESRYLGQIVNFGFRLGVPMSYLSHGPTVDDAVHAASARELAERILPITHHAL
jgi:signal recognition particle GTPase